ncbi:unnamed protein product [Closterium sp. NIES-53]
MSFDPRDPQSVRWLRRDASNTVGRAEGGSGGGGGGGAGRGAAAQRGGFGGSQRQQQPRSRETPSAQQLREWYAGRGRSGGAGPCTYVLHTGSRRGETQNVSIFDLDFDAILATTYDLTDSAEGDCYVSVPLDPGIEAAALGASASAALGTGESAAPGAAESALSGTAPTVIVTIGLNVPKTKDRLHRRISAQRLQTLIAFWSQLQMT